MYNKCNRFIIIILVYHSEMEDLKKYIKTVLGADLVTEKIGGVKLNSIPFFIKEGYVFYWATFYGHEFILVKTKGDIQSTTLQIEKQLQQIKNNFKKKVILVAENITAINRKRLIDKGVNFIVPGKQLFLPALLIDLREDFRIADRKQHRKKLLPSAQFILLYKILYQKDKIEQKNFKELAEKFGYTQMAITKAIENLKYHELCRVEGGKEKNILFDREIPELWRDALPLMNSPVLKTVYVDEIPRKPFLYMSNVSALPEYSNISPGRQEYYAIDKHLFYSLQRTDHWKNLNEEEGPYCLEIWKYDPAKLAEGITEERNVDPLSLYLSLKDTQDERIDMALDNIIEKNIW